MKEYEDIFSPAIQGYREVMSAFEQLRTSQPSVLEEKPKSPESEQPTISGQEEVDDLPF